MYWACSAIVHGVRSAVPLRISKMAMMNLQSCHILLQKSKERPKWRCYFEQYCVASRLVDNDETHKVSDLGKMKKTS